MITDHHPDDVREQIAVLRETTYRLSNDSNATHEQHENRIAALETYRMDTNAVEARQDDDINRLKGRVGDLHEVILKLENGVKDGGLATSFVKDAWRKDINERVAANEARIKALEDRLQTVWIAPINALKERCFALDNAVDSLKLCVPTPPEELYSIGTSRKLRRLPPWCGCPHATAVCAMVDAGKMWEPANCGICQWRIISWNPTEPKTPFVPRGNNPPLTTVEARIEEIESRMSGMCELQQIQEGKAMETRNIDDERFEKLELLSLRTDERIDGIVKRIEALEEDGEERLEAMKRPTTMNYRLNAIDHQAMTERLDKLESAVATLKLCLPPPQPPCPPEAHDEISEGIEAMRVLLERMASSMWGKPKGFDSGVA